MWPYRILDARAQKECSWRVVHVLQLAGWASWGAARHHRNAGHESRIKQTTFVKFVAASSSLLLVWFAGDMKSERPSRDDEQHYRCVVWEGENCFAVRHQTLLSPHQVGKALSFHSFIPARRRTSTGFASRRFSCWQSENQKDSRLGRVRIIISDGTCALLNAQQIKMVSREACVCAMCSRTGQGCMCACVRTFITSWEVQCAVDQTPAVALHLFCSLLVNLLCRKPEIESLGFTCNWLVLVGRLAWTSATCTYFRVAEKFTTAKRKAGTLYQILRDTQLSFGCCVGLAQLKETPAHRNSRFAVTPIKLTTMHKWANLTLTCTSCHVDRGDKCDAPCTSKTSSFHSSAAGTWSFGTLVRNNISVVQLKPTKKYLQRLLVPLAFATTKSALYLVGSPAHPKMLAAVANRWADPSRKCLLPPAWWRQTDDGACLRLAHAQVENEIPARPRRAPRRGAREYRRLRAFPIWGIHIQTKSTFICGINGVGGGGGVPWACNWQVHCVTTVWRV